MRWLPTQLWRPRWRKGSSVTWDTMYLGTVYGDPALIFDGKYITASSLALLWEKSDEELQQFLGVGHVVWHKVEEGQVASHQVNP